VRPALVPQPLKLLREPCHDGGAVLAAVEERLDLLVGGCVGWGDV
jgi:hypothetical protein